ncbi:MAG: hypothetical protein AAFO95_18315, partial [Cyanobacteria bacterium J06600_6]
MILEIDKYVLIPIILIFCFVIPLTLLFKLTQFKLVANNPNKLIFALRPIFRLSLASILGGIGVVLAIYLLFNNYLVTLTCTKIIKETENIEYTFDTKGIVLRHQHQFIPNLLSAKIDIKYNKKEEKPFVKLDFIHLERKEIEQRYSNLGVSLSSK